MPPMTDKYSKVVCCISTHFSYFSLWWVKSQHFGFNGRYDLLVIIISLPKIFPVMPLLHDPKMVNEQLGGLNNDCQSWG